jgi:hypothetical protein
MADEVYQENVWKKGATFVSFRKVCNSDVWCSDCVCCVCIFMYMYMSLFVEEGRRDRVLPQGM